LPEKTRGGRILLFHGGNIKAKSRKGRFITDRKGEEKNCITTEEANRRRPLFRKDPHQPIKGKKKRNLGFSGGNVAAAGFAQKGMKKYRGRAVNRREREKGLSDEKKKVRTGKGISRLG